MKGKNHSKDISYQPFSCIEAVERLATLASVSSEEQSPEETPSREAEHVSACSASPTGAEVDRRLKEVMRAFAAPERYPDEPDIHLSVWLQEIEEREQVEREKKRQRKQVWDVMWKDFEVVAILCLGAIWIGGTVLIVWSNVRTIGSAIASVLVLMQCLIAAFPLLIKTRKRIRQLKQKALPKEVQKEEELNETLVS